MAQENTGEIYNPNSKVPKDLQDALQNSRNSDSKKFEDDMWTIQTLHMDESMNQEAQWCR